MTNRITVKTPAVNDDLEDTVRFLEEVKKAINDLTILTSGVAQLTEDGSQWRGGKSRVDLVFDSGILTSATDEILADIDLDKGEALHIDFEIINDHTANVDYSIYGNNESGSGYRCQIQYSNTNGGTAATSSYATPIFAWCYNVNAVSGNIDVHLSNRYGFSLNHRSVTYTASAGNHIQFMSGGAFRDTNFTAPLTGLAFRASNAAGFGVGTRIRVYKREH
jgi:hypothetical protein